MRILLCEDEKELSNAISTILKHKNYSVDVVYDGQSALDCGRDESYDVILLDIMMPKMNGLEVLKQLRLEKIQTPILMLSAKGEVEDKIKGLDSGADDYLPKPFAMAELVARIRALTRRQSELVDDLLNFEDLELNRMNYEMSANGQAIRLSNKEYQMLEMMMTHPNRIISTETFMEKIWGYDSEAEINVVWVYISALRKKILQVEANVVIQAARGVGYKLVKAHD